MAEGKRFEGRWKHNEIVAGQWKPSTFSGRASFNFDLEGRSYEGEWKNGLEHGIGTCTYSNGNTYTGGWSNGQNHGHGMLRFPTSCPVDYIDGKWTNGSLKSVVCYYKNGAIYDGEWRGGIRNGVGKVTFPGGTLQGTWINGVIKGDCLCIYSNGDRYEGGWKGNEAGMKHGQGTLYSSDGNEYRGMWVFNSHSGENSYEDPFSDNRENWRPWESVTLQRVDEGRDGGSEVTEKSKISGFLDTSEVLRLECENSTYKSKPVHLISMDEDIIMVRLGLLEIVGLMKLFVDVHSDSSDPIEVPLPKVTSQVIKLIMKYLEYYFTDPMTDFEKPLKSSNLYTLVQPFYADFIVKMNNDDLFHLTLAADFMDIRPLLDLCSAKIASMIKDKTVEEIRVNLDIVNDFTPEEEAKVRSENLWIEELFGTSDTTGKSLRQIAEEHEQAVANETFLRGYHGSALDHDYSYDDWEAMERLFL